MVHRSASICGCRRHAHGIFKDTFIGIIELGSMNIHNNLSVFIWVTSTAGVTCPIHLGKDPLCIELLLHEQSVSTQEIVLFMKMDTVSKNSWLPWIDKAVKLTHCASGQTSRYHWQCLSVVIDDSWAIRTSTRNGLVSSKPQDGRRCNKGLCLIQTFTPFCTL